MQLSKKLSPYLLGLLFLLTTYSAQATDYIVAFKSAQEFESVRSNFYAAPIHGENNEIIPGKYFPVFAPFIHMTKSLDHLQMIIVESENPNALSLISKDPRVLVAEQDQIFPAPAQMATFTGALSSAGAMSKIPAMPWGLKAINAPAAWKTTRGAGVKVLIVDTGLDRNHPEFTGRLVKGKNFLGRRASDPAPYDFFDNIGHGTHVAGLVLGTNTGVAPEASLLLGRVCGSFGCGTAAITQAVDWGVGQGVNVMNLSLGGPCSRTVNIAYTNAVNAGITVVAATGNSAEIRHEDGTVTYKEGVSCPGAFNETVGTGAIGPDYKRAGFSQFGKGLDLVAPGVGIMSSVPRGAGRASDSSVNTGGGLVELESSSFQGSASGSTVTGDFVYGGLGKPEDFKGQNFRGKIALMKRGELFFADKAKNAIAAGATAAVIFNHSPGLLNGAITQDGSELAIPVIGILQTDGERFKAILDDCGQTVSGEVKVVRTDYTPFQGTSMASPHVAGVSALIVGAQAGLSYSQVRNILKSTATALGDPKGTGAGLVNSEAAVARALQTTPR